ncbi:LOW QUALITY PROTEIN: spermatogenesis-associated protein 32 [Erethizon dorsatum]
MARGGVFPCCGKEAVEILEPQIDLAHCDFHPQVAQEEDKTDLETELLAQEPDPDSVPELESLEREPSPHPAPRSELEPEPVEDGGWKVTTLVLCHESSRQPVAPRHQHVKEEAPVSPRSCYTQTSKHLFWADKFVQVHKPPAATRPPQPPPGPQPEAIGLVEVVHFATALAMASSSCMDLPSLGHKIKAPSQKAVEPSPKPIQPTSDKEELLEKPPEARGQEDKSQPYSYLDFSNQGLRSATIEGGKFVQTGAMSPQLQGAKEDSVPGTKKGNPLLLKIHFKMSSSPTLEK